MTYTVKPGDSLDKIARKYGVSVKDLIKENNLKKPYIIRPGQKLKIPTKGKKSKKVKKVQVSGYIKYKVKPGDSLIKIAKKFGVSTKEIIRANNLKKPYHLKVGQILKIPKKTAKKKSKAKVKAYRIYKVKSGDTLSTIAKKFGVSTKEIIKANNLKKPYLLRVGQKLKIPVKYTSKTVQKKKKKNRYTYSYCSKRYRVKPGDSLIKIAKKFGVSVKTLKRINNLRSNTLRVGQTLCIKKVVKSIDRKGYTRVVRTKIIRYKVKPGDSLIKIAKKFKVYTKDIIRLNKLKKPYHLRVGQILKIPKKVVSYIRKEEEEYFTELPNKPNINFGFIWPVNGEVINHFVNNSVMRHLGIDIQTSCGEKVRAAESGKVIFAGDSIKPYGRLVILRHKGKFNTVYGHLGDIYVRENQYVKKGQVIGEVGNLNDTACGIYFEIRKNTVPVDPLVFLSK
jgi:LysM repeat protein